MISAGFCNCWMTEAIVKVLPVPVAPSRTWCLLAVLDTLHKLVDGFRLVAGGLEGSVKFEFHKSLYFQIGEQSFYYSTIGSRM